MGRDAIASSDNLNGTQRQTCPHQIPNAKELWKKNQRERTPSSLFQSYPLDVTIIKLAFWQPKKSCELNRNKNVSTQNGWNFFNLSVETWNWIWTFGLFQPPSSCSDAGWICYHLCNLLQQPVFIVVGRIIPILTETHQSHLFKKGNWIQIETERGKFAAACVKVTRKEKAETTCEIKWKFLSFLLISTNQ